MAETTLTETDETSPRAAPRDDAVVTFVHRIEAAAFDLAIALARTLGVERASAFGGFVLRTIGPLLKSVERRAAVNMRIAFPDASDDEIKARLRDAWDNLGRTGAEYAHLDAFRPGAEDPRVEIIGEERLQPLYEGRRTIFVSGHFANWEVLSIALHRENLDYSVVYRAVNNPLIDARIIERRSAVMSPDLIPKDHRGGKRLLRAAREGRPLALLVDQKLNEGIESLLFGRMAMTSPTPARLALKYKADVVPVRIRRRPHARFVVEIGAPLAFERTGDLAVDVPALTERINQEIEAMIREEPGQWLWFHRRYPKAIYNEDPESRER